MLFEIKCARGIQQLVMRVEAKRHDRKRGAGEVFSWSGGEPTIRRSNPGWAGKASLLAGRGKQWEFRARQSPLCPQGERDGAGEQPGLPPRLSACLSPRQCEAFWSYFTTAPAFPWGGLRVFLLVATENVLPHPFTLDLMMSSTWELSGFDDNG